MSGGRHLSAIGRLWNIRASVIPCIGQTSENLVRISFEQEVCHVSVECSGEFRLGGSGLCLAVSGRTGLLLVMRMQVACIPQQEE